VTPAHPQPVSPDVLSGLLADLFAVASGGGRIRVAVDGADAARPGALADALVEPLRRRGVAALRVRTRDFLRPASLRYEFGRTDPDAYYSGWLDAGALAREVLRPLGHGGTGRWLPAFWDAAADRATRAAYEQAPVRAVLLVDGPLLLGHGLPFDLSVHVHLTEAALARRTPPEDQWTLPAHQRYAAEVDPLAVADVVVRADDPRRPAVQLRDAARRTDRGQRKPAVRPSLPHAPLHAHHGQRGGDLRRRVQLAHLP